MIFWLILAAMLVAKLSLAETRARTALPSNIHPQLYYTMVSPFGAQLL